MMINFIEDSELVATTAPTIIPYDGSNTCTIKRLFATPDVGPNTPTQHREVNNKTEPLDVQRPNLTLISDDPDRSAGMHIAHQHAYRPNEISRFGKRTNRGEIPETTISSPIWGYANKRRRQQKTTASLVAPAHKRSARLVVAREEITVVCVFVSVVVVVVLS